MSADGGAADEREQGKFVDLHRSIKVRSTYTTIIPEFFFFFFYLCYDSVNLGMRRGSQIRRILPLLLSNRSWCR